MPRIIGFFTSNGAPTTGLSATLRIRRVDTSALVVTDAAMTELGDGMYGFNFDVAAGYSETRGYAIRLDGSATLRTADRFKFAGNTVPLPDGDNNSVRVNAAGFEDDARDKIRDSIISDATTFAGANIDAAVSSRSSHSAAGVQSLILSDATPFPGANINATISTQPTIARRWRSARDRMPE